MSIRIVKNGSGTFVRLPSVTWWKGYLFGLLMGVVLTGVIPIVITEAMT